MKLVIKHGCLIGCMFPMFHIHLMIQSLHKIIMLLKLREIDLPKHIILIFKGPTSKIKVGFPECSCCLEYNMYSRICHDYGLMIFYSRMTDGYFLPYILNRFDTKCKILLHKPTCNIWTRFFSFHVCCEN